DDHFDSPCPRSPCMKSNAYHHLFASGAISSGVAHQPYRVCFESGLPEHTRGSPSYLLRNSDASEDKVVESPPPDPSEPPSNDRIAIVSPPSGHNVDS
ncbi:hypothetical protein PIB30_034668, partial [Stylosanthes scabra]|nr:hypothetical protein [Stylosanthes scabra]